MRKNPHLQLQDLTAKSLSDDDDVQDQPGQGKKKISLLVYLCSIEFIICFLWQSKAPWIEHRREKKSDLRDIKFDKDIL